MEERIAKGFDRLALHLEDHIKYYKPGRWVVSISNVAPVPMFASEESKIFMEAQREGKLKSKLEELSQQNSFPFNQLKPFYIKEAIQDFFDKKLYASYESELK